MVDRDAILARVRSGTLTQAAAAAELGISKQRVSQIITGWRPRRRRRIDREPDFLVWARAEILARVVTPTPAYNIARMLGSTPLLVYPLLKMMETEGLVRRVWPGRYVVVQP